jgi:glycosyltransferase involved in cell wall biosynthesis
MRIIHLSTNDIDGGASRSAYRIHHSLLKQGVNSRLWVNEKKSNDPTVKDLNNKIGKAWKKLRLRVINYFIVKMLKTENKIIHSPSVLPSSWVKHINNSDADIVHLHWTQYEMLSIKDISKIKKPIVWTLHDMWAFCGAEHYTNDDRWREGYYSNNRPHYESGFDLNRWTWNRKKKYWNKAIQIVTPSVWLAKCVCESALMKNWPVSVIAYPIDTDQWTPIDKQNARQLLNLSKDANLILFGAVGGGEETRKGYNLLLSALEYLKADKKIKKIELVVFGQDKPKSQPDFGFPIHYSGYLYDDLSLRVLYSAADVMVVPSLMDNLPNTAIESQACGTPVVSFNIGGLPDIIDHQKTGYIAQAFDTRDLAYGITWILEQSDSKKLGNNARERAVEKFSEKKISDEYVSIYKKLCKEI